MNWIILIIAGLCEMSFTFCLGKMNGAQGYTFAGWLVGLVFFYVMSIVLLAQAIKTIPIGTAYAVWTGIGAVGAVLIGIFFFHEPVTFWRLFFISTLLLSIIGLKITAVA
jgi:quaternary ammonium compound-resistance protein SugE